MNEINDVVEVSNDSIAPENLQDVAVNDNNRASKVTQEDKESLQQALLDHNRIEIKLMNLSPEELVAFGKELTALMKELQNPDSEKVIELKNKLQKMKEDNQMALVHIPEDVRSYVEQSFRENEDKLIAEIERLKFSPSKKASNSAADREYQVIFNPNDRNQHYITGQLSKETEVWMKDLATQQGIDPNKEGWVKKLKEKVGIRMKKSEVV